jgi:hypothetical protein
LVHDTLLLLLTPDQGLNLWLHRGRPLAVLTAAIGEYAREGKAIPEVWHTAAALQLTFSDACDNYNAAVRALARHTSSTRTKDTEWLELEVRKVNPQNEAGRGALRRVHTDWVVEVDRLRVAIDAAGSEYTRSCEEWLAHVMQNSRGLPASYAGPTVQLLVPLERDQVLRVSSAGRFVQGGERELRSEDSVHIRAYINNADRRPLGIFDPATQVITL